MFWTTVDDGTRMLRISRGGKADVVVGPQRVWAWGYRFQTLQQYVAHPGEFLVIRMRNGVQEHVPGPAELWFDPRVHLSVEKEESLQIDTNEAVVAYTTTKGALNGGYSTARMSPQDSPRAGVSEALAASGPALSRCRRRAHIGRCGVDHQADDLL
ncbi:MAG: hypothetical protein AAF605_08400 [Myxococcota bacterium]